MTETLYVLETGSYLRREGESLKIFKEDAVIAEIPANGLKKLILVGHASMSGAVLDFLIRNRVETVFLTPTGRYRARLAIDEHRHVALRMSQYLRLSDSAIASHVAGSLVKGKIENMYRLMILRARNYEAESLRIAAIKVKSLANCIQDHSAMDYIRGIEGATGNIYFSVFPEMIKNDAFIFKGRNRRPPLDPMNAMLSFVYTLLTNEVLSAIKTCGLDPYLGSLHEISYGRPSLACDLVEEYRSYLGDRLVLGLVNKRLIRPDDFIFRPSAPKEFVDEQDMKARRPVEMKPGMNRTFIAAYEEMMNRSIHYPPLDKTIKYRWLIYQQVKSFGKSLENPELMYQPFLWEM
jgi:CRISPR-associated protein Cas1